VNVSNLFSLPSAKQLHGYDLNEEAALNNYNEHSMEWHKNRESTDSYQESEGSISGSL
jgi:hypothetical protein